MNLFIIAAMAGLFFGLLFVMAAVIERHAEKRTAGMSGALIYGLSLAIYCTSWTFYGSVGRAATSGIAFAAVYAGPIALFLLGRPLLARIITIAKAQHCTSIADFVSSRYGKSRLLGGMVTVIAVVGIMPYIALQLKAVSTSVDILSHYPELTMSTVASPRPLWADPSLYVAIVMMGFCWLFGTQRIDATEQHRGLVTAVAIESVVKLVAFLAVGGFAVWGLAGGLASLFAEAAYHDKTAPLLNLSSQLTSINWWAVALASAAAIICLPRQFQVLVVENADPAHLRTAAWLFPAYLVLINLFVLPIALVGNLMLPTGLNADTFVLSLPIAGHQPALVLLVFLGGLSAATAMVLMEVTALSTMICNDLVVPLALRRLMSVDAGSVERIVKAIRRGAIVLVLSLAYIYFRLAGESQALVNIGLMSFAAAAQFAPAIIGGLIWPGASKAGAVTGLAAGFVVWWHTALLPSFGLSGWLMPAFLQAGSLGIGDLDPFTLSLMWSLLANTGGLVLVSLLFPAAPAEHRHAMAFLGIGDHTILEPAPAGMTVDQLMAAVGRFAGWARTQRAFADYAVARGGPVAAAEPVDTELLAHAEQLLAGAIGAASARLVLASTFDERNRKVTTVTDAVASTVESSRGILVDALDELGQGVLVMDAELHLSACNRKFQDLFALPDDLIRYGTAIETIIRHNAERGEYGPCDIEATVERRVALARSRTPHRLERERPDGTVLEVMGTPLPNGGLVITYLDATRRHRAEQELRHAYDVLEKRVAERTLELSEEVQERVRTEIALRASKSRLEGITDNLFEGVLVVDQNGVVVFANASARRLLLNDMPLEGRRLDDLFRLSRDGRCLSFQDSPFAAVIDQRRVTRGDDALFITEIGKSLTIAFACSALEDDAGICHAIISFRSIEALKVAQREAAQASRLAAVGQLAAGIAHEINTPVQYVGNNLAFVASSISAMTPFIAAAKELSAAARDIDCLALFCNRLDDAAAAADLDYL